MTSGAASSAPRRLTFVGTGSEVGKTWVAVGLIAAMRSDGLRVGAAKPIESGVDPASGVGADTLALSRAAALPPEVVCPWPLPRAVTPASELVRLGMTVSAAAIVRAIHAAEAGCDAVVIETAGGVLSPLTPSLTSADLASLVGGSTILVVDDRLGAISWACTAHEALRARDVNVAAIALNSKPDADPDVSASNEEWIGRLCPETRLVRLVGDVLPLWRVLRR